MRFITILCAALMVAGCAWKNPNKPFRAPEINANKRVQTVWKRDLSNYFQDRGVHAPVQDSDGRLFTAAANGAVFALDKNGETLWKLILDENIYAGVVLAGNNIIVMDAEADLIAIDKLTGEVSWRSTLSSSTWAAPRYYKNKLYVHTFDGTVHAISAIDGQSLWQYKYDIPQVSLAKIPMVQTWNNKIIVGQANGLVVALDADSGTLNWQVRIGEAKGTGIKDSLVDVDAEITIAGDYALVAAMNGELVNIDLSRGVVVWSLGIATLNKVLLQNNTLIVADMSGDIQAFEFPSKKSLWFNDSLHNRTPNWMMPWTDEEFFISDYQGYLYLINYKTGALSNLGQTFARGLSGHAFVPGKDRMMVQTKMGLIYLLNFKFIEEDTE